MSKLQTSISVDKEVWDNWKIYVTKKYGSARKISQAVEESILNVMNLSEMDELEQIVKKKGRESVNLEDIGYDFEAAVAVMNDLEKYINSYPDVNKTVNFLMEEALKKTKEYAPHADDVSFSIIPLHSDENGSPSARISIGLGMIPLGIKFIYGDGFGVYLLRCNTVNRGFFAKRKEGEEDGIIFRNRFFFLRENDVFEIKQIYGEGRINYALYAIIAGSKESLLQDPLHDLFYGR